MPTPTSSGPPPSSTAALVRLEAIVDRDGQIELLSISCVEPGDDSEFLLLLPLDQIGARLTDLVEAAAIWTTLLEGNIEGSR